MIIEDKDCEKMPKLNRINDNIIYLGDIWIEFFKIKRNYKTRKAKRTTKKFIYIDEVFTKNSLIDINSHLCDSLKIKSFAPKVKSKSKKKKKVVIDNDFTMEITKVILKKELSCSFV